MQKLDGKTMNVVQENIEKMKELFPEIFTEDKIDFEKLQLTLGEHIETEKERYQFTWNGKTEAIQMAQKQSTGTLRPCKEESVDWDTTQNLYLEGDNLEVMRLLQNSYRNKVKMIYIDPPYNTGKDFVYKDNFYDNVKNYKNSMDESYKSNAETSGRYHTEWLNMLYPRLKLSRNLLKDDGVIFISIDDNEVHNLRKICDEIYGEDNFVSEIIWEKKYAPQNDAKYFSLNHEQILCYAKNKKFFNRNLLPMTDSQISRYTNRDNDTRGLWQSDNLSVATYNAKYDYPIETPSGKIISPPSGYCWRVSKEKFTELVSENRIWFGENGENTPRLKRFLSEVQQGRVPISIWYHKEVGHTQSASQELKKLFGNKKFFDFPKPIELIKRCMKIGSGPNDIILDFFSGSSTTAHALLELNLEEKSNRKFIMIQIPEKTSVSSDSFKDGYRNICEIGKERIRLAANNLKAITENSDRIMNLDVGFKVFKLDETNLKIWDEESIETFDNLLFYDGAVKDGRSSEDILYEILLKYGVDLTVPIEEKKIGNLKAFSIGMGYLVICLDHNLDINDINQLLAYYPDCERMVFLDDGFSTDEVKINAEQILKRNGVSDIRVI